MKKDFKIEFSSFMTKKEREILKLVLDSYLLKKELNFDRISLGVPKLKNNERSFFERLVKKGVWVLESGKERYISYFSNIILVEDRVVFQLNETFLKFITNKRLATNYSLYDFLFLKSNISLEFFFKYMVKNLEKDFFEIPLIELKSELGIENYNRMYDLDRFVFQLIKEDINRNTQYMMDYEKIKIQGKVEKIKIYIKSKRNIEIETNIKMLLLLFRKYIKNRDKFISLVKAQLKIQEYSKLKKSIVTAIKLLPEFNYEFEKALNFVIEKGYNMEWFLIKKNTYEFENNHTIFKYVFRDINFYLKEDEEVFTQNFTDKLMKKIYSLKDGDFIVIETEKSKLELKCIKEMFSIAIYSKKNVFSQL